MRELQRLFARAGDEARRELRSELRLVAEPVRGDAEALAASSIRRIGIKWSRMRIGVTQKLVYVAPRQRGVKGRGVDKRRRPAFATLLQERAMEPVLRRNEPRIVADLEGVFERLAEKWSA